ncbi:uncharacterized protein EV420DRAFT_80499 [Desarmillaria tabescens]|uniref:Uncharacterized protein n=1 Tax=Armillaria tabescens TaxID=1929756 RepID=A0AA39NR16_ARMTA|nr:uncharacterized protein EV420DRAFT_80499 [Desarmillaria tabescens]KAK0469943.1 hypothetical protein EV420DRAFT_80499 [Desarmillaria tabescens]
MNIILCASLAMSIMQSAKNCSLMHHGTCMQFAALYIETSRFLCITEGDSSPYGIKVGPSCARRGMVASVRLVGDDCALLPGGTKAMENILTALCDGLIDEEIAQEVIANFETAIRADIALMPDKRKAPVTQMLLLCKGLSTAIRMSLEKKVVAMKKRKNQFEDCLREIEEEKRRLEEEEQRLEEEERKLEEKEKKLREAEKKLEEEEKKLKGAEQKLKEEERKLKEK